MKPKASSKTYSLKSSRISTGIISLRTSDPELFGYISDELERQRSTISLIAAENIISEAVLGATGNILTNKSSEGYPGRRYHGGTLFIDKIEALAIRRAKSLFNVPHANVQPLGGSVANFEVYLALCRPGDTIMGQSLTDGGHLSHGWHTTAAAQFYKSVQYHVKRNGYIDIEEARRLAVKKRPSLIWIGSSAYSRRLPFKDFSSIADKVGAYLVADIAHVAGLIAGGVHESPAGYAHIITTTTHKTLRGVRGAIIMVTKKGLEKDPMLSKKIDKAVFPGLQSATHNDMTAGIAATLHEASKPEFRKYARQVVENAKTLSYALISYGINIVTGGTDNHMMIIDLRNIRPGMGIFVEEALEMIGIITNRNTVPGDPTPFYPSGLRLGTSAVTARGMKDEEMRHIAGIIRDAVQLIREYRLPEEPKERAAYLSEFRAGITKNAKILDLRFEVSLIADKFPIYQDMKL